MPKIIKSHIHIIMLILLVIFLFACKKGSGAICNDGSRSYSTGSGTCSWHGGVDHYINPNEIDVAKTSLLSLFLIGAGILFYNLKKENNKEKSTRTNKKKSKSDNIFIIPKETISAIEEKSRKKEREFNEFINSLPKNNLKIYEKYGVLNAEYSYPLSVYDNVNKEELRRVKVEILRIKPADGCVFNMKDVIETFPHLTELDIGHVLHNCDDTIHIPNNLSLPNINKLYLASISHVKFNKLISSCHSISKLGLYYENIRDLRIENIPNLKEVHINHCTGLPSFENLPNLKVIYITCGIYIQKDFNKINATGLKYIVFDEPKKRNIPKIINDLDDLIIINWNELSNSEMWRLNKEIRQVIDVS